MRIEDIILNFLSTTRIRKYKGVQIGMFGLPVFAGYNKRSIYNSLKNLEKRKYVVFSGSTIRTTAAGRNYYAKRQAKFQSFDSPFKKDSSKNLILMFDIPEARKAEREWLRRQLETFGYIMIQKSVWVGPSPLPEEFKLYLKRIKLEDHLKTFKLARAHETKASRA